MYVETNQSVVDDFDSETEGGTPTNNPKDKNEDDVSMIELKSDKKKERPKTLQDMLKVATKNGKRKISTLHKADIFHRFFDSNA